MQILNVNMQTMPLNILGNTQITSRSNPYCVEKIINIQPNSSIEAMTAFATDIDHCQSLGANVGIVLKRNKFFLLPMER